MDKKAILTFLYAPVLFLAVSLPCSSVHTTEHQEKEEVTTYIYANETPTTSPKPTYTITQNPTINPTKTPTQKPTETPTEQIYIYLDIPLSKEMQEYTY